MVAIALISLTAVMCILSCDNFAGDIPVVLPVQEYMSQNGGMTVVIEAEDKFGSIANDEFYI